jgi:DNA-binding transcriptional regulator of glucitol operon
MLEQLMRNWPTLLVGVVVLAVTFAFLMGRIDLNEYIAAFGVLTGGGFMLSKTFNVSGKPEPPKPGA